MRFLGSLLGLASGVLAGLFGTGAFGVLDASGLAFGDGWTDAIRPTHRNTPPPYITHARTGGPPLMVFVSLFEVDKDEWRASNAVIWLVDNVFRFLYIYLVQGQVRPEPSPAQPKPFKSCYPTHPNPNPNHQPPIT